MTTNATSPTAQRWELARRLKELRLQHERSLDDVARELMCSAAKVSRMETAARGIQRRDVRDLCRFYGVPAELEQELMDLATEAGRSGWWAGFRTLQDETAQFIGLESAAVESRVSYVHVVPGLLQTQEYTAHLLRGIRPAGELTDEVRAEWVQVRTRRQERLNAGSVQLRAIVDEAALVRPIGPRHVMAEQVAHLMQSATLPNVHLQVVPFDSGSHPGLDGSFHYLHFAPDTLSDVVFVEGHLGMFIVEKATDTLRYRTIFDDISTHYALTPASSIEWLKTFYAQLG